MRSPEIIFAGAATSAFQASSPIQIVGEKISLDFQFVVTDVAAQIQFYLEYTAGNPFAPATPWYAEMTEELQDYGVVRTAPTLRQFYLTGGADLAIGTHNFNQEFVRVHQYARIQLRALTGTVRASVTSVFNSIPQAL